MRKKRPSLSQIPSLSLPELEVLAETSDDPEIIDAALARMLELDPIDPEADARMERMLLELQEEHRRLVAAEELCRAYENAQTYGKPCTISDEAYLDAKKLWLREWTGPERLSAFDRAFLKRLEDQTRASRKRKELARLLLAAALLFAFGAAVGAAFLRPLW